MRVSDIMLNHGLMNNISRTKQKIDNLSAVIAKKTKINKPSDGPETASRIFKLGIQSGRNYTYTNNISSGIAFLDETIFAMESVQKEVSGVLTKLSELNNATVESTYKSFAMQIDMAIESMLNSANSKSDGKFIFGGTVHSASPFGFNSANTNIETKTSDISGEQLIRITPEISKKINLTGSEVFGTILSADGNLNSAAAVGDSYTVNGKIYNTAKEEFNLSVTYTKTADNTYSLGYDITDLSDTSIFSEPPASIELKFNPDSGKILTLNGSKNFNFKLQKSSHKIDLTVDLRMMTESASADSVSFSLNQKTDIFNTLIRIRDDLNRGIKPSQEDEQMVKDFNSHLLNKISEAGNMQVQLFETEELLVNQRSVIEGMISKAQDVDIAKAIMDLQTQDYMLQMAYKVSSAILPKSLLDYI